MWILVVLLGTVIGEATWVKSLLHTRRQVRPVLPAHFSREVPTCGLNAVFNTVTNMCECSPGFVPDGSTCVPESSALNGALLVLYVWVPILLILVALLICCWGTCMNLVAPKLSGRIGMKEVKMTQ